MTTHCTPPLPTYTVTEISPNLAAAAPELLAALRDSLHYIENHPRCDQRGDAVADVLRNGYIETARAAIAKATA